MVTETSKATNAIGGKKARACDICLHRRACWYCSADDAFLCQNCNGTVHSANHLASRHHRVRLKDSCKLPAPAWHQGFTRKARTPRQPKPILAQQKAKDERVKEGLNQFHGVVPEIGNEDGDENEEMLLHQVPVFDPFEEYEEHGTCLFDDFPEFLPSEMDLAEFAADMECLLGGDDKSVDMKGLGLGECKEEDVIRMVKVKDEEEAWCVVPKDVEPEVPEWRLDWEIPVVGEEEEEEEKMVVEEERRKMLLRLNYEGIISAWASKGSPWTTGSRPEINPEDDRWPSFTGGNNHTHSQYVEMIGGGGFHMGNGCAGDREARVTRYREKKRSRLFAKKIRYQVRKLNAEKRPRMKGRFVKRTSLVASIHSP